MKKYLVGIFFAALAMAHSAANAGGGGEFVCVKITNLGQTIPVYNGPACAVKDIGLLTQPCDITYQGWTTSYPYSYVMSYSGSGCGNVSQATIGYCQDRHYNNCEILDVVESNYSPPPPALYPNFQGV